MLNKKDHICLSCLDSSYIFTYGANEKFIHGRGAALHAKMYHGAVWYKGPYIGNSYGISTKDGKIQNISLARIKKHVDKFIQFSKEHPELKFFVTEVGTGLAGKRHEDIAPMFVDAPENCVLSEKWKEIISKLKG